LNGFLTTFRRADIFPVLTYPKATKKDRLTVSALFRHVVETALDRSVEAE